MAPHLYLLKEGYRYDTKSSPLDTPPLEDEIMNTFGQVCMSGISLGGTLKYFFSKMEDKKSNINFTCNIWDISGNKH